MEETENICLFTDSISGESDEKTEFFDFTSILKEDWSRGLDISQVRNLSSNVFVYQILKCVDISVPKHRVKDVEEENGDFEDKNSVPKSRKTKKSRRSNRMLKLILYDGNSNFIGFEYEPIGAFDVFFDSSANCLSRCCVKIALYNSPVFRRNSFWLTNSNVKLLFEGYSCKGFTPVKSGSSYPDQDLQTQTQVDVSPDIVELASKYLDSNYQEHFNSFREQKTLKKQEKTSQSSDFSSDLSIYGFKDQEKSKKSQNVTTFESSETTVSDDFENLLNFEKLDNQEKNKQIESSGNSKNVRFSNSSKITDFNTYFARDSNYPQHSYLAFLKKHKLTFDNQSFLKFSGERFVDKFVDLEINLENFCKILNFSCESEDSSCTFSGPYNDYKFGFLNHSSVIKTDFKSDYSNILNLLLEKIFNSTEKNVWFAIFDDCISCYFCIFILDIFPFLSSFSDEISLSLDLNSLEGFFQFEDFEIQVFFTF